MNPLVVTIAWGEKYYGAADRLEKSAAWYGLAVQVERRPEPPEARVIAWKQKPRILLNALEATNGPVLWLDADCVIRRRPSILFDETGFDVAAFESSPGRWEDGVLLVMPTPGARSLLQGWAERCAADNVVWTHEELSREIKKQSPALRTLPPEYCWNHKWASALRYPGREPVIEANA